MTQASPDEYITGNNASNFPSFGPAYNNTLSMYISWLLNTFVLFNQIILNVNLGTQFVPQIVKV